MSAPRTLWYTRCPLPTASGVAIERGLLDAAFAPLGIAVQSLNASLERQVREAHFDHGQPGLFRQGGMIPPIWSRARGADTLVIATGWIDEYQAVIALPDSGIRSGGDLRGRRLGVPCRPGEQIDYWRAMCLRGYHSALQLAGLAPADVEFVALPIHEGQIPTGGASQRGSLWHGAPRARRQSREALALVRGEVDAIYTASPAGAQLTAFLGAQVVVDIGAAPSPALRSNNQVPAILTVDGTLARTRPDLVVRYLAALFDAADWARAQPSDAAAILSEDVGTTKEWLYAAHGDDVTARLAPALDPVHIQAVSAQKDFLLGLGLLEQDFDLQAWIAPEFIEAAAATRGSHATA